MRADDRHLLCRMWFLTFYLIRFPGGESLQDVVARTSDALQTTLGNYDGATVVTVGHDSVNRALRLPLLHGQLFFYPRARTVTVLHQSEIDIADGRVKILRVNVTTAVPRVLQMTRQKRRYRNR